MSGGVFPPQPFLRAHKNLGVHKSLALHSAGLGGGNGAPAVGQMCAGSGAREGSCWLTEAAAVPPARPQGQPLPQA